MDARFAFLLGLLVAAFLLAFESPHLPQIHAGASVW